MAANIQDMAGASQMMPQQQMHKPNSNQLHQIVYQNLVQHTPPFTGICWQANVPIGDRMGKSMNLISNIALAMNGIDSMKAVEFGCSFEREMFYKSPTKEAYEREMTNKIMDFYKKRKANELNLPNAINANAQVQAQAQAQAQAMINMQAQMRHSIGQSPQHSMQPMQHPVQGASMPQQRQIATGMPNQAGRGIGPNQQILGTPSNQARLQPPYPNELSRLSPQDKSKVAELAARMMSNASEQAKANTRIQLQQGLPVEQLAELQVRGKDPLLEFYHNQAFEVLKAQAVRLGPGNLNTAQGALLQSLYGPQQQQQQQQMPLQPAQTIQPPGFKRHVPSNNRGKNKSRLTSIRRDKSSVLDRNRIKSSSKTLQVDDTQGIKSPQNTKQASRIVPLPELIEPSKKNVSQYMIYTISEDYTDLERVRKSRLCSLASSSAWKGGGHKF